LVEVFCSRLSIAFDNVILYEQLQEANARLEERVGQRTRELTLANERLAAQWERLRRIDAFKREILGTVAHDLKNPLGVVMGRAEMMKDLVVIAPGDTGKLNEQIDYIQDTGRRMLAMVDTLLADAMADALDISLRLERVDLTALVHKVVAASRPLADRKQQTIAVHAPPHLPARADPDRLWEAIDNLVNNAIKYTPAGGRIDIAVEGADDENRIVVRDDGLGLLPEDISRLFGRFQRLSAKPTAGESSTGLGLSIVKRIVDLHGGRVQAESAGPNRGTTFCVALPLEHTKRVP
jgi:signal transduction histidine kinase